jgi:hypothetical protein
MDFFYERGMERFHTGPCVSPPTNKKFLSRKRTYRPMSINNSILVNEYNPITKFTDTNNSPIFTTDSPPKHWIDVGSEDAAFIP